MNERLKVKIIAPDAILFEGEADYLSYPVDGGERGVLPGHTRLIATLAAGDVRLKSAGTEKKFPVKQGLIKISHSSISLLVS